MQQSTETTWPRHVKQSRGLTQRLALLTGLAVGLVGIIVLVLELQATSTAWIVAQGHWSRGQQGAVAGLYRYLDEGQAQDLVLARQALDVPLGDREARLALEAVPADVPAARAAFLRGGIAPADIPRVLFSFRHARDLPMFSKATAIWQQSDAGLLELQALLATFERQSDVGLSLDPAQRRELQGRLQHLDLQLQAQGAAFSTALRDVARRVHMFTLVASIVSVLAITALAILLGRRVRSDLFEQESQFRATFHHAHVGMLKMDEAGQVLEANPALAGILGLPRETLLGMPLSALLVDGELVLGEDGGIDWPRQLRPSELRFRRCDGGLVWGRWSGTVVPLGRNQQVVFAIVEDVTEAHVLAREVERQASHDPLTGLINRHEIERRLEQALRQVHVDGAVHVLCQLNLDHFKLVNDSAGHAAGDQLLRAFAACLEETVGEGDWVGRLGADEFMLFMADTRQQAAVQQLQHVMGRLGKVSLALSPQMPAVACSIGVLEINAEATDVYWVMSAADSACYAAKQAGRNRVHCFNESRMAVAERREQADRLRRVRQAIADDRMVLYAQRILHPAQPERLHYEVLVRMRDTDGTLHGPETFLAAVERYGMGMALDRCVLSMLFRHLQLFPAHVRELGMCNVNVSAQSIAEPAFLPFVIDLLERNRALAERLCLEITETAVISNLAQARGFIEAVKARGCRIALDDFGAGVSSFGYLRQLPADLLKIDGAFVRDMDVDPVSRATVRAIAALGRDLDLEVVAEWVEGEGTIRQLQALGVQALQGHAVERPVPLERMTLGDWRPGRGMWGWRLPGG